MYEGYNVYGPYVAKDGRQRVVLHFGEKTTTVSYPKYLVECTLKRYLGVYETIDHIDGNPLNNNLSNLRIVNRAEHSRIDVIRHDQQIFVCPECSCSFAINGERMSWTISNRKKDKAGPFCSRSCAGKYGVKVQKGMTPVVKDLIAPKYTKIKSSMSLSLETVAVEIAKTGNPSRNADGNPVLGENRV